MTHKADFEIGEDDRIYQLCKPLMLNDRQWFCLRRWIRRVNRASFRMRGVALSKVQLPFPWCNEMLLYYERLARLQPTWLHPFHQWGGLMLDGISIEPGPRLELVA